MPPTPAQPSAEDIAAKQATDAQKAQADKAASKKSDEVKPILVKAIDRGHFGGVVRSPGDKFEINSVDQLGSWMEIVDLKERDKHQGQVARVAKLRPPGKFVNDQIPATPVYAKPKSR